MPTKTWTNTTLSSSDMNTYVTGMGLAAFCIARGAGTQTLTSGPITAVLLGSSEDFDSDNIHSLSTGTNLFTPVYSGYYILAGYVGISANASGTQRFLAVRKNAATPPVYCEVVQVKFSGTAASFLNFESVPVLCNGTTDTLDVIVQQDSGSTLTISTALVGCYRLRS